MDKILVPSKRGEENCHVSSSILHPFCSSLIAIFVSVFAAHALTNGLALTPPMGWNDWNTFGCGISDAVVRQTADAMATNGMKAAGYEFINIDDCWASSRDSNGVVVVNASKFPNGIKALADYVHSKGLKLGLYTDHGTNTCSSSNPPGSYGYEYLDAMTYASWGVDYLKNDSCKIPANDIPHDDYFRMADGLMKSGRPIVVSICANAAHYEYWSPDLGNLWRTTGDIKNTFASMISKIDPNSKSAYVAGPGRWNDPDMMEVGRGDFTDAVAARSHFTMWCIMAAPLIAGNDIRTATPQTIAILTNPEAIAVDQDPAGEQGIRVGGIAGGAEVWSKPLGYDFTTRAVALFNRSTNNAANITCAWTNLGLQAGPATLRDLWAHADLGIFTDSFTTNVPPMGVVFLKIVGTPVSPPAIGTTYLTDLKPVYAYTGFGTMTKDKSINGNTLTLGGVTYGKGIGTHAIGGNEYNLGGIVSRFQADIGVDDEVGASGSVIFQVFADGLKIYDSGIMTGSTATKTIDLDVTGVRRLTLGVTDTGNDVTPGSGSRNNSDHSDWANARVIVTNNTPQPPPAPTGLTATGGNSIRLTWNYTSGAISYNVRRAISSGGSYTNIAVVPVTTFIDTNTAIGVTYYYVVSAVSGFGEGPDSTEVNAASCNVPPAPGNLKTTTTGAPQTVLTWNAVSGANGYTISRFTGNTPPIEIADGWTPTNFTDTTVANGVTYFYFVTAVNSCGASPRSDFIPANVPPVPPTPPPVWTGGSALTSNWSDSANWGGTNINPADSLFFAGNTRLDNVNDTPPGTVYSNLTFNAGAGTFSLHGNPILLRGNIVNNSSNPQAVNIGLVFSTSLTFDGAGNTLILGGGITNALGVPGFTTTVFAGQGILTNRLKSAASPGGTNVILLNGADANWTLLNNSSSTPMTVPWVFSINRGNFNFGSATSAPILNTTPPNNSPQDNQVSAVANSVASFNILGGTLTTASRLNTATALNATGIVNQVGGTFNLGSQFQGANGANAGEVSIVNVSGGTMNISGGGGPFYVASRGGGTLNVSGDALLNCGTLDVSRNANGNSIGSVGVVNLDGGTILANRIGTATANAQTSVVNGPSAKFYFNGGALKMNSSSVPFFQGSTVPPVIPISAIVKSGGAIIDSNGHDGIFAEPLLHDDGLGSTSDGGLTKNGSGSLVLVSNLTYTGDTAINEGTLVLSNSVALNHSARISISAGATLDVIGRSDGTLALVDGQTLAGNGTIRGNTVVGGCATIAPGNSIGTLTFNNDLTLNADSITVMEIRKSPATNDTIVVGGDLIYGGTLVVTNIGTESLVAGDSFKLFDAAHCDGAFANIIPVIPGLNLAWNTNILTNGILSVIVAPTPRPQISEMAMNGNNFVLSGSNGVPGWNYELLASTNLTLPIGNWTVIFSNNNFDAGGRFAVTNLVDTNLTERFFLLRLLP